MQSRNVNLEREDHLKITETNLTIMIKFVLLSFTDIPQSQWFLLGVFLVIYMIILLGNGVIILITRVDTTLQTPMYFFLRNFSFLEICYVSVTLPRMLVDLRTQTGTISFFTGALRVRSFLVLGATECCLLAVTACDQRVAVWPCALPLAVRPQVCVGRRAAAWISGAPAPTGQTCRISLRLSVAPTQAVISSLIFRHH